MMKNARNFALALALAAGSLAAVGCGGSVEQPQTQASAGSKAPIGQNTHGMVKVVGEALGEVSLRPEQRAELEKLAAAAEARHAATLDGRKELALALADQVEKGAVDRAALQPRIDRVIADMEKVRPEDKQALARVHALLDADQRNAFVDALEAKMQKHHGHHGGKGKHGHGPKAEGEHDRGEHRGFGGPHGMMKLGEDLKLTDDQKDKIKEVLKSSFAAKKGPSFREMHAKRGEGKRAIESFRTDKFDADAVAPPVDKARAGSGHFIEMAEKIVPILTPEQRKIAADKIREMANKGGPF
jgi:Spy/CpxP family protein refolding chaperone